MTQANAQECTYPTRVPQKENGVMQYRFIDSCGNPYELGYRLEGVTLHFPRGGHHQLPELSEGEAEALLRDTYGLVGERDALIRTRDL